MHATRHRDTAKHKQNERKTQFSETNTRKKSKAKESTTTQRDTSPSHVTHEIQKKINANDMHATRNVDTAKHKQNERKTQFSDTNTGKNPKQKSRHQHNKYNAFGFGDSYLLGGNGNPNAGGTRSVPTILPVFLAPSSGTRILGICIQ